MKIISKRDLTDYKFSANNNTWFLRYSNRDVKTIWLNEINNFEKPDGSNPVLNDFSSRLSMVLGSINYDTNGKRILELGCGAKSGNIESVKYDKVYEPWFGRFIHLTKEKTGLEYIGVDCGDISSEPFPHKQINLLEKQNLVNNFPKNYFDIVVAFMLFNSPELERRIRGRDTPNASYQSGKMLVDILLPQLKEIIKPEGIFLWSGGNYSLFN